jgi:hypothetical protein
VRNRTFAADRLEWAESGNIVAHLWPVLNSNERQSPWRSTTGASRGPTRPDRASPVSAIIQQVFQTIVRVATLRCTGRNSRRWRETKTRKVDGYCWRAPLSRAGRANLRDQAAVCAIKRNTTPCPPSGKSGFGISGNHLVNDFSHRHFVIGKRQ